MRATEPFKACFVANRRLAASGLDSWAGTTLLGCLRGGLRPGCFLRRRAGAVHVILHVGLGGHGPVDVLAVAVL